jgi:hypothetical protein
VAVPLVVITRAAQRITRLSSRRRRVSRFYGILVATYGASCYELLSVFLMNE